MSKPPPKRASTIKMLEPRLTAPMAVALLGRRPTIIVSTMAMLIHPSSASTRGMARLSVGRNSARSVWSPSMGGGVGEKSLSGAGERSKRDRSPDYQSRGGRQLGVCESVQAEVKQCASRFVCWGNQSQIGKAVFDRKIS